MINSSVYKWEPLDRIPNHLCVESITNDESELTILGVDNGSEGTLSICFRAVVSFQSTDETNVLKRLDRFPLLSTDWPLFICKKSSYIEWLIDESYQIVSVDGLSHYVITHGNGIIDVICYEIPEVKWL